MNRSIGQHVRSAAIILFGSVIVVVAVLLILHNFFHLPENPTAETWLILLAALVIHKVSLNITDAPVEITLSLATPYLAYLAAESIHASGVLSAVVRPLPTKMGCVIRLISRASY